MKTLSLLESMDTWTPEQLLAVHDFCQQMGEMIWGHHRETLIDHLRQQEPSQRIQWSPSSLTRLQATPGVHAMHPALIRHQY